MWPEAKKKTILGVFNIYTKYFHAGTRIDVLIEQCPCRICIMSYERLVMIEM